MTRRSQQYPRELRERAVRMVAEVTANYDLAPVRRTAWVWGQRSWSGLVWRASNVTGLCIPIGTARRLERCETEPTARRARVLQGVTADEISADPGR